MAENAPHLPRFANPLPRETELFSPPFRKIRSRQASQLNPPAVPRLVLTCHSHQHGWRRSVPSHQAGTWSSCSHALARSFTECPNDRGRWQINALVHGGRKAVEASESDLSSSRCPTDLTTTTNMWPTRGQRTPTSPERTTTCRRRSDRRWVWRGRLPSRRAKAAANCARRRARRRR
jgi:hypothetical protein